METPVEFSCRIVFFKAWLPKGPLPGGGLRQKDLVQIYTDPGGMRTLALETIKSVR